jgi:hypothetical protein
MTHNNHHNNDPCPCPVCEGFRFILEENKNKQPQQAQPLTTEKALQLLEELIDHLPHGYQRGVVFQAELNDPQIWKKAIVKVKEEIEKGKKENEKDRNFAGYFNLTWPNIYDG